MIPHKTQHPLSLINIISLAIVLFILPHLLFPCKRRKSIIEEWLKSAKKSKKQFYVFQKLKLFLN